MTFKKIKYFSILLIALLDLTGQTVTMDAMGTQKDIAEKIIKKKGDYVLALKGNHPLLYEEVKNFFAEAQGPKFRELYSINNFTKKEKGHGRIECVQRLGRNQSGLTSDPHH